MPEKEKPRVQVSWQQLVAGALAAMTSAWLASSLGVSGTIIGAAVGSFSASIATALYLSGLHRGETLVKPVVRPVIRRSGTDKTAVLPADSTELDETVELGDLDPDASPSDEPTETTEPKRKPGWFSAAILGGAIVLIGVILSIGAFEFFSGDPFGNADRPAIGRPWEPPPTPSLPTTSVPTRTPSVTPTPTRPTETPTMTPTDDPTPEPTPPLELPEEALD